MGELTLVASDVGLVAVAWDGERASVRSACAESSDAPRATLARARRQLDEYFRSERTVFDLPLDLRGTAFAKSVWAALQRIPFGETRSYGELARDLGDPKLTRAVGAANGQNPVPIVIPCHRVIGASGALIGFGGGLQRKRYLLDLESAALSLDFSARATDLDRSRAR